MKPPILWSQIYVIPLWSHDGDSGGCLRALLRGMGYDGTWWIMPQGPTSQLPLGFTSGKRCFCKNSRSFRVCSRRRRSRLPKPWNDVDDGRGWNDVRNGSSYTKDEWAMVVPLLFSHHDIDDMVYSPPVNVYQWGNDLDLLFLWDSTPWLDETGDPWAVQVHLQLPTLDTKDRLLTHCKQIIGCIILFAFYTLHRITAWSSFSADMTMDIFMDRPFLSHQVTRKFSSGWSNLGTKRLSAATGGCTGAKGWNRSSKDMAVIAAWAKNAGLVSWAEVWNQKDSSTWIDWSENGESIKLGGPYCQTYPAQCLFSDHVVIFCHFHDFLSYWGVYFSLRI